MRSALSARCPGTSSLNAQQATLRPDVACFSGRGRGNGFNSRDGLLLGGSGGRDAADNNPVRKLVLPGSGGPPMGGGRLVFPDKGMEQKLAKGAEDRIGAEVITPTGPNGYRPPAGFMNETPNDISQVANMPPELMLSKLRSRAGKWHFLAKMFPQLALAGYDNNSVDELTGITPVIQSRWMVAATVYDSLVASGKMSEEQLGKFDKGGDELLYPFRFLTQEMRVEAAEYILANNLEATECDILSRSMKEWERRPLERHGFTNGPGDCMAFKYLRDAFECRQLDDAEVKLEEAMKVAATDGARARLEEAMQTIRGDDDEAREAEDGISGLASLTVLRLDPEDIGFRPIPLLGQLGQVSQTELDTAPRTTQDGAFGAFTINGQGATCRWVALPQWKALAMMRHPVALSVQDCSTVQAMLDGMKIKTEDDRRRLVGPGLILADRCQTEAAKVDVGLYYLALTGAPGSGGKLQLLEGAMVQARGLTALATVAFVARPPAREQPLVASPESSLIQL